VTLEPTQFTTETQLWNAIVRQFGLALPLPAGQVVLAETDPPVAKGARFAIGIPPNASFSLVLEDYPFGRLTGVEITLDEVMVLPAPLSEGLLLGALDSLRAVLPVSLATQVQLPSQTGAVEPRETWLSATVDLGSGALARCRIGARRQDFVQVLSRLFPAAAGAAPRMPAPLLDGLSVEVALAAGQSILPVAALRSLEPGDVVLCEIHPDRRLFLVGAHEVEIGKLTMTEGEANPAPGWAVKEIRMTGDNPEAASGEVSLDDVPVTLRFVTDDRRIALADLQGLSVGAILPIEAEPLSAGLAVRIQANGVTVGEGHLVQIDDRFAVRVARMAAKKS